MKQITANVKSKTKFVCLKHLESALMYTKIIPCDKKIKIPYYVGIREKKCDLPSLNIFEPDGKINIVDIRFIRITASVDIISEIKISNYQYKGKELKLKEPYFTSPLYDTASLEIPIEIFEVMLIDTRECVPKESIDKRKLSSLLYFTNSAYGIMLLDKNKKELAFALQMIE